MSKLIQGRCYSALKSYLLAPFFLFNKSMSCAHLKLTLLKNENFALKICWLPASTTPTEKLVKHQTIWPARPRGAHPSRYSHPKGTLCLATSTSGHALSRENRKKFQISRGSVQAQVFCDYVKNIHEL